MASRVIRVDDEVYAVVLAARHRLEAAIGRTVSMGSTVAFLAALRQKEAATP